MDTDDAVGHSGIFPEPGVIAGSDVALQQTVLRPENKFVISGGDAFEVLSDECGVMLCPFVYLFLLIFLS